MEIKTSKLVKSRIQAAGNYESKNIRVPTDISKPLWKQFLQEALLQKSDTESSGSQKVQKLIFSKTKPADVKSIKAECLHHAVVSGSTSDLEYLLSQDPKSDINARNCNGSTLLHTAVRGGQKDIVQFLLTKGANTYERNAEGETPLQVATDPDIANILRNSFSSYVPKLSADLFKEISVQDDSNSLFWSITLAYLYPVCHHSRSFKERFKNLFGHGPIMGLTKKLKNFIQGYNPISIENSIYKVGFVKRLVKNTFRKRVLEIEFSNPSLLNIFTVKNAFHGKNGDYLIQGTFQEKFCNEFKTEINENNIDVSQMKPDLINENNLHTIDDELSKVPDQIRVKQFICNMYKNYIYDVTPPGSYLEIETISLMLNCNIVVFSGQGRQTVTYLGGKNTVYLYKNDNHHYNFGLIRAEELIESVISGDVQAIGNLVNLGVDNINHKHTGGWTAMHFAAHMGNLEIMRLLANHGARTTMKDLLNRTPYDVALLFKRKEYYSDDDDQQKQFRDSIDACLRQEHKTFLHNDSFQMAEVLQPEKFHKFRWVLHLTEMLMFFFLQGLEKKMHKIITGFSLSISELSRSTSWFGRMSADIIFRYKYINNEGWEKSKVICLQVNLNTSGDEIVSPDDESSVTSTRTPDLERYLKLYQNIKRRFLAGTQNRILFGSTFRELDSVDFIIYTDAASTFSLDYDKNVVEVNTDEDDVLGWQKELGNKNYWKLNLDKVSDSEIACILQNSSECAQLAEELAMHFFLCREGICTKETDQDLLRKYSVPLRTTVIREATGKPGYYVFRKTFLEPDETFSGEGLAFRESLFSKSVMCLLHSKNKLRGKAFQLPFQLENNSEQSQCTSLPMDLVSGEEFKAFLCKLKFFVCKPEQTQLREIVKKKIQNIYSVDQNDAVSAFSDLRYNLLRQLQAKLTSINLGNEFFEDSLKVVLFSKVKNWDKIYHLTQNDPVYEPDSTREEAGLLNFAAGAGDYNIVKFLVKGGIDINRQCFSHETALNRAIRNNHYDVVELLVENGAKLSVINEGGESPLHIAVALERTEIVKLLASESNLNFQDSNGNVPLHHAAKQGNLVIVQILVEMGSNINASNYKGKTILHAAVEAPEVNFEVISYLVEQKVALNCVDNDGWTPLHSAAYFSRPNVIQFLQKKGIYINSRTYKGETPLHLASMSSNKEAIKSLLQQGANIHSVDHNGRTFLDIAKEEIKQSIISLKEYNDIELNPWYENAELMNLMKEDTGTGEVCSMLQKVTVDINAEYSPNKETFLHFAIKNGTVELVKLLLDRGADIHIRNDIGESALHIASRTGNNKIVRMLLDKGIDVSGKNCCGETALHEAARVGYKDTVLLLFQEDPEAINNITAFGDTALHKAAINGHINVVEFLLRKGAIGNSSNVRDETPLHVASISEKETVEELLLNHRTSIKARDCRGNTPLHIAAMKGKHEIVEVLLNQGADVHARNLNRETPLHVAYNKDVVALLIDSGADINAKTSKTSLHFYSKKGKINNIRELLKRAHKRVGGNTEKYFQCVRVQDEEGIQAIHLAAREGHRDVVALLLNEGALVDAEDYSGLQPLHFAAREGHKDVVEFLCKQGQKKNIIEAHDNSGMLPIHLAAREGNYDVVEFFLKSKKDLQRVQSAAKITPLHLAAKNLHIATINLLLKENATIDARDISEQTFLHYFSRGLYDKHRELVRKSVELMAVMRADVLKHQALVHKMYEELMSDSKCKVELLSTEIRELNKIREFTTLLDVYSALQSSALKSAKATENVCKGEESDVGSIRADVSNQIIKVAENQKSSSDLEIVLYFPKCLLFALDVSLCKSFTQDCTIPENELDDKESILVDFSKALTDYNDFVDDILSAKKEKLEKKGIDKKRAYLLKKIRDSSSKLSNETQANIVSDVSKNVLLLDVIKQYIKLTNPKDLGQLTDTEKSLQKLSIQRALQVIGEKHAIEILKEHLHDTTIAAVRDIRNNYLSHSDDRSNLFARVMVDYKDDAFNVVQDLNRLVLNLASKDGTKIKLKKIELLCEKLTWLSEKDKELKAIVVQIQDLDASIRKGQSSLLDETDSKKNYVLEKQIKGMKRKVQRSICGTQGNDLEKSVREELDRYVKHLRTDISSEWKVYLGIPVFYKRLQLLRNKVLKESHMGRKLQNHFTYTVNQNLVEKTVAYLKKYKKSQAESEFLIFDLRSVLSDSFSRSKGNFDKKVGDKLENMIGNRRLRNYLAHLAHGNRLCHELTDFATLIAHEAHMFMNKGEVVAAFTELCFIIQKDGKKWNKFNENKTLFRDLIDSNYSVEFLNALNDITGDITMLGDEIEDFLGSITESEFNSMLKKCEQRVELLKFFRDATAHSKKEKLKRNVVGYLEELSIEEFIDIFGKQNNFLEIVEKIIGHESLPVEVKKYISNPKLKEIKKSRNFEDYLRVLRDTAEHFQVSEILERHFGSAKSGK